jgi:hypothetical protein
MSILSAPKRGGDGASISFELRGDVLKGFVSRFSVNFREHLVLKVIVLDTGYP